MEEERAGRKQEARRKTPTVRPLPVQVPPKAPQRPKALLCPRLLQRRRWGNDGGCRDQNLHQWSCAETK